MRLVFSVFEKMDQKINFRNRKYLDLNMAVNRYIHYWSFCTDPLPSNTELCICRSPCLCEYTQPCSMFQKKTKGLHHSSTTQIMQPPPL